MKQRLKHLLYAILLILIDQGSKYWAKTTLREKGPISIIPKILKFQYHENDGAVWGILSGRMTFLIIFTVLLMGLLLFIYFKLPRGKRYTPMLIIWVFIMSGAIGNFIDRVALNYVVDFIYIELIDFPIFNLADMYLTMSCALLLILGIFYYKEKDFEFMDYLFKKNSNTKNSSDTSGEDE